MVFQVLAPLFYYNDNVTVLCVTLSKHSSTFKKNPQVLLCNSFLEMILLS